MTDIEKLRAMIASHHRIVFFGGAGVSTESNIPDFRGANGLYRQKTDLPWTPEEMLSHHFYEEHPVEFFTMYKQFAEAMLKASPNRAHFALAKLEQEGRLSAVITQNIDGLHQRAGSRNVIEVHGTILTNTCEKCFATYDPKTLLTLASPVPHCPSCGGVIKPDVVLYEEPLNEKILHTAVSKMDRADTLIIGGTSLAVYPAAGLVDYFHGKNLVVINLGKTSRNGSATLSIASPIGEVMRRAVLDRPLAKEA